MKFTIPELTAAGVTLDVTPSASYVRPTFADWWHGRTACVMSYKVRVRFADWESDLISLDWAPNGLEVRVSSGSRPRHIDGTESECVAKVQYVPIIELYILGRNVSPKATYCSNVPMALAYYLGMKPEITSRVAYRLESPPWSSDIHGEPLSLADAKKQLARYKVTLGDIEVYLKDEEDALAQGNSLVGGSQSAGGQRSEDSANYPMAADGLVEPTDFPPSDA